MMATEQIVPDYEDRPVTRAEIAEAITNLAATAARIPRHHAERKASLHDRINNLLDQYEQAPH